MKIFFILSLSLLPCALLFPAPVKTPPQKVTPVQKIQPARTAVLMSFDGFTDMGEFLVSPEKYNLSTVYQSLMFQLGKYSSNILIIDTGKTSYIPNSSAGTKDAIASFGLEYLIKLNLSKSGKASTLEIAALNHEGIVLLKNKVLFYEKISPETFENIYAIFNKTISQVVQDAEAQNLKKGIAPPEKVWVTNLTTINIINKVSVLDLAVPNEIKKTLIISGDVTYIDLINSYGTICVSNQNPAMQNTFSVDIYPGLNYLRVGFSPPNFGWNSWGFKNEQMFLINNRSLKSTNLNINDYKHYPVNHFFLSIGLKKFFSINEPVLDLDFGCRFGVSRFQKIKLALSIVEQKNKYYYSENTYTVSGLGVKFGLESSLGNLNNAMDYAFCFYFDILVSSYQYGMYGGVSLRIHPLLSFNAGVGINLPINNYNDGSIPKWDGSVFLNYDIYIPFPQAAKNYENFH